MSYIFYHPFADKLSCFDKLEIEGSETETFCGTTLPAPYTTRSNVVKLIMTSNGRIRGSGFDLTFTTETSMLAYNHPLQLELELCESLVCES